MPTNTTGFPNSGHKQMNSWHPWGEVISVTVLDGLTALTFATSLSTCQSQYHAPTSEEIPH